MISRKRTSILVKPGNCPDNYSSQVIVGRYYANVEGFVDLRRTQYIERFVGGSNSSYRQSVIHESPVINDCVYRHMYRFDRIAVIDFDEVGKDVHMNKL